MAKSRYSIEQKQEFVMAYREATGKHTFLNAEEIARWCNETYMLVEELHGRDFRRPQEMKEWFEQVNRNIEARVVPSDKPISVITASLVDIEHIIRSCRSAEQLRAELQSANRRFAEVIDTNQKLAYELNEKREVCLNLQRDVKIIKENHNKVCRELDVKERKWKSDILKLKKQLAEKKRSEKMLLQYMCKYVADPIAADHFANELRLLVSYPGREVVLPEHLKELKNDDRPFGMVVSAFDKWLSLEEDVIEDEMEFQEEYLEAEYVEDEAIEVASSAPAMIMTEGETAALDMLEDL